MKNRGLSNIVVTVLLILISIVLIGILWVFFGSFILQIDETTNVADCYTAQFELLSCEYAAAFTDLSNNQPYKPVLFTVRRKEGAGDVRGLAFQTIQGEKTFTSKDPTFLIKEFESITKVVLFPLTQDFTPENANLFPLVGEKNKICKTQAATISCACHQVTNQQNVDGDINCDGSMNGFDVEAYTLHLFNPHRYEFVTCTPNAGNPNCPFNNPDLSENYTGICPDFDGDGVVREFDIAEVEARGGGGTAGCQT